MRSSGALEREFSQTPWRGARRDLGLSDAREPDLPPAKPTHLLPDVVP